MSTILDALKKSEQERKRKNTPTLSDMPTPQEQSRWPIVVIALLSLTLALVVGVLISLSLLKSEQTNSDQTYTAEANTESSLLTSSPRGGTDQINNAQARLDDIVVNVVSYSDDPASRFVMLNGKLYRENDFVRAGLKVERIEVDVVILNNRGELFRRAP